MLRSLIRFAVIVLVLVSVGCGSSGRVAPEDRPPVETIQEDPQFLLGPGDKVRVSVWKNPDLSVEVPVRPDGFISVPLVGDVRAGGRTPSETAADTEQKLLQFIRTPQVSIIVTELNSAEFSNRVRVVGAVSKPVSIPFRKGMTVLDLVLEAGGLNEFASPQTAKLYRKSEEGTNVYPVYLKSIFEDGVLDSNFTLLPGDVVSVPERRF